MVKMEYRGTGRVRLADFYNKPASGAWQFQESSSYLRAVGALDESDPAQPSVMLANYITAPANCIASSGFYSVCCKSECEGLQGHLEEKIGAPEAKADTIATLISFMPSNTATKLSRQLRHYFEAGRAGRRLRPHCRRRSHRERGRRAAQRPPVAAGATARRPARLRLGGGANGRFTLGHR